MLTAEFNIDIAKEVWQEEAREEARKEAIQKSINGVITIVKNWGIPLKSAMTALSLPDEYRNQVEDELRKQGVSYSE